jgi:hypothetical protein
MRVYHNFTTTNINDNTKKDLFKIAFEGAIKMCWCFIFGFETLVSIVNEELCWVQFPLSLSFLFVLLEMV